MNEECLEDKWEGLRLGFGLGVFKMLVDPSAAMADVRHGGRVS